MITGSVVVTSHQRQLAAAAAAASRVLHGLPRYYLTVLPDDPRTVKYPRSWGPQHYLGWGPQHAVIRDTVTGAAVATIRPPRPFRTFREITGAGDGRTFVLAAEGLGPIGGPAGPVKFFQLRTGPAGGAQLRALPIPEIPANRTLDSLALSPDASRLAIAVHSGSMIDQDARTQIRVYSLATGAVRVWRGYGQLSFNGPSLSWAARGPALAFGWMAHAFSRSGKPHYTSAAGFWLLNTATAGGSLLADSRLAVPVRQTGYVTEPRQPHGFFYGENMIMSRDGRRIAAVLIGPPGTKIAEYSTRTGRQVGVPYNRHIRLETEFGLVWINGSGSELVIAAPTADGKLATYGALTGHRFIPIP